MSNRINLFQMLNKYFFAFAIVWLSVVAQAQTVSVRNVRVNSHRLKTSNLLAQLANSESRTGDTLTIQLNFNLKNAANLQELRIQFGKRSDGTQVLARQYTVVESNGRRYLVSGGTVSYVVVEGEHVELLERLPFSELSNTELVSISGKDKAGKEIQKDE